MSNTFNVGDVCVVVDGFGTFHNFRNGTLVKIIAVHNAGRVTHYDTDSVGIPEGFGYRLSQTLLQHHIKHTSISVDDNVLNIGGLT